MVSFSLPGDVANTVLEADRCEEEASSSMGGANEGGDHTVVRIEGHANIGGLYEILIQDSTRVPILLSRSAFLNSRCSSARLGYVGSVNIAAGQSAHTHPRVEVKGWLLPCATRGLCHALATAGNVSSFEAKFKVDKATAVFARR